MAFRERNHGMAVPDAPKTRPLADSDSSRRRSPGNKYGGWHQSRRSTASQQPIYPIPILPPVPSLPLPAASSRSRRDPPPPPRFSTGGGESPRSLPPPTASAAPRCLLPRLRSVVVTSTLRRRRHCGSGWTLQGFLKKAKLLARSAPPADKNSTFTLAPQRSLASEVPVVSSAAKRTTSQPKAATEAADYTRITVPAANSKQQQRSVQHAAAKTEVPKPRPEELARAAAREEFRQMLLQMEKSALPDETIYPKDLEEFGIAPFEFVVTRTRKQAWLDAKKWTS